MVRAMIARLVAVVFTLFAAAPALAVEGAWSTGQKASVRLIVGGIGADGKLSGGIEIRMPEGWHTYWRMPGDAGIAPTFDFSGSLNVGAVEVSFPVPTRRDDGLSVTNVYDGRVVLPFAAEVIDPAADVELAVAIDLGVCADICVPDTVTASVRAAAGPADAAAEAMLQEARALLPGQPEGGFAVEDIVRDGGSDKRPVFRVRATVPDAASADVFVEGPGDWASYRPVRAEAVVPGEAVWSVKFSRLGAKSPVEGATFRITVVSDGRAIEQFVPAN